MISYFSKLSRFERQITKLRGDRFWAFSKEWDNAISIAIANKNGDYLEELYHCLKDASDRTPEEFPLWYLLPVPREIETLFASKTTKSDCYALHNSLRAMSSDEQEEVVKKLIKFWLRRDRANVPNNLKEWATPKQVTQPVQREVVPHGAIANSVALLPRVEPIISRHCYEQETEKVSKILMNSSKVRFIGAEGCGKTSKARWLCRERIALGHKVYWINPHLNADDKHKLLASGVTIVGGGRDYSAIADFCAKTVDGENSKLSYEYGRYGNEVGAKFEPVTFVLDELTNYKDEVGEPIEKFIKSSMQEFSKINWHTVYIAHNDTLACMGAPSGTANLIKSSVFDLRLETDILKGNRVPKAIAKYRMPSSDDWADVQIPIEWQ
jgi:hypothetical protein